MDAVVLQEAQNPPWAENSAGLGVGKQEVQPQLRGAGGRGDLRSVFPRKQGMNSLFYFAFPIEFYPNPLIPSLPPFQFSPQPMSGAWLPFGVKSPNFGSAQPKVGVLHDSD